MITKFTADPNDPTQYKRKKCYMQLMAVTKGQNKPIGMMQFNLTDFLNAPMGALMKLTFSKCFDKNAAIVLTSSITPLENSSDHLETESSATVETISDTYSERSSRHGLMSTKINGIKSSFTTCEETSIGSFNGNHSKSASFSSNFVDDSSNGTTMMQKSGLSKQELENQKLKNEVERYKGLLSEFGAKLQNYEVVKQ